MRNCDNCGYSSWQKGLKAKWAGDRTDYRRVKCAPIQATQTVAWILSFDQAGASEFAEISLSMSAGQLVHIIPLEVLSVFPASSQTWHVSPSIFSLRHAQGHVCSRRTVQQSRRPPVNEQSYLRMSLSIHSLRMLMPATALQSAALFLWGSTQLEAGVSRSNKELSQIGIWLFCQLTGLNIFVTVYKVARFHIQRQQL